MYVDYKDLGSYPEVDYKVELDSAEDVATLLSTFEEVRKKVSYDSITGVTADVNKNFYMILNGRGTFDLYSYIAENYESPVLINCINARLLFPESISRRLPKPLLPKVIEKEDEPETGYMSEDDVPTGYLDEDLSDNREVILYITNLRDGVRTEIPKRGLTMGRSKSKADYVISGNTNVGRVHCNLYYDGNVLKVHDLKSLNGTYVNNRRVREEDCKIGVGDKLTLADEDFEISGREVR